MPSDFPFLDSLTEEINKAHFDTEERARQMLKGDLADLHARKEEVFTRARDKITQHKEALSGMMNGLDAALARLSNSGERPTGQNSSDKSES